MAQSVPTMWREQFGMRHLMARVELLNSAGGVQLTTDTTDETPLVIDDLTVSYDRTRNVWGTASCRLLMSPTDPVELLDLLPTGVGAPLAPTSGTTFRVSAGFHFHMEEYTHLVYCGRFDIDTVDVTETAAGIQVDLTGIDLLGRCDIADIVAPGGVDIPWNRRIIDASKLLITDVMPWMMFDEDPSDFVAGRLILAEKSNRLESVRFMAAVVGQEAVMSMDGTRVMFRTIPTTNDSPAWIYPFDQWGEVFQLSTSMDRKRVFNGVVAEGENPNSNQDPIRAELWITDPNDPTYYIYGAPPQTVIGPRPYFLRTPYIQSQAQAVVAAEATLRKIRGLLQRVKLEIPVNPAINVGDVIYVDRPAMGIVGRYMVEALSFDLSSPKMTLVCEERRV